MKEISQKELFSDWANKKIKNVYYFVGEETAIKKAVVKKLKEIIKPDTFNFAEYDMPKADISDVLSQANTTGVFSDLRMVILNGVEKAVADEILKITNYIKNPSPCACFILTSEKRLGASDAIAKSPEGTMVNFAKLNDYEAQKWIRSQVEESGASILPEAVEIMIKMAGTDTLLLKNEINKLVCYHHGKKKSLNEDDVLKSMGFSKDQNPFELSMAIQNKNKDKTIDIMDTILSQGMEPLRSLYNISSTLQKIFKVKILSNSGMPTENMHYLAGISKNYYYHVNKSAKNFHRESLAKNIQRCLEAEALFKTSKSKNPAIILKQIIYGILR